MRKRISICVGMGLLWAGLALGVAEASAQAIPVFAPDDSTSWFPDRPQGDDFLPPPGGGPGPILSDPAHPYVTNDEGRNTGVQPTYRVADLSNPILTPWAIALMKKANDDVLAGKVPFIARERCWPGGVPQFDIFRRVAPVHIFQTEKEVLMVWAGDAQVRHVYLNVPHSQNVKPSWYGESVGHYEGDELVVDTVGQNNKTVIDNYRTPHTELIHVVERFKLIEGGNTLQVLIEVDDPAAFKMPWRAMQRFKRYHRGPIAESICAENNFEFLGYSVVPIPQAGKPDF